MKLGQGNKFTGICLSTLRGEYLVRSGPGTPPLTRYTPHTRYTPQTSYTPPGTRYTSPGPGTPPDQVPPDQVHPLGPGTLPQTSYTPQTRYTPLQIWTTSGRYASYWNAFLLEENSECWRVGMLTMKELLINNSDIRQMNIYIYISPISHKIPVRGYSLFFARRLKTFLSLSSIVSTAEYCFSVETITPPCPEKN